ncbi:hypothetical protein [Erythrobacter litoralis]|uniref:hypothetical protein n=1 Tax=Erythrobacter litoralis TaxID=39960 RepID=UPI002435EA5F|nr:hypothetical protein [Erythrobacter litoralis]
MIDIAALERETKLPGESAVVTRRWLDQVLTEIREGRAAKEQLGRTFGLEGKGL